MPNLIFFFKRFLSWTVFIRDILDLDWNIVCNKINENEIIKLNGNIVRFNKSIHEYVFSWYNIEKLHSYFVDAVWLVSFKKVEFKSKALLPGWLTKWTNNKIGE